MNITFRILLYFTVASCIAIQSVSFALPLIPFNGLLDDTAKEIFEDFIHNLKIILPLGGEDVLEEECCFNESTGTSKSNLAEKMKESLASISKKVKDDFTKGKIIHKGNLFKGKDIKEKMKGLQLDVGSRAQDLLSLIKDNADSFYKTVVAKFHRRKRSTDIRTEIERLLLKFVQKLLVEKFGIMVIRGLLEDLVEKTPFGKKLFNNSYSSSSLKGLLSTDLLPYKDELPSIMKPLTKLLSDVLRI